VEKELFQKKYCGKRAFSEKIMEKEFFQILQFPTIIFICPQMRTEEGFAVLADVKCAGE